MTAAQFNINWLNTWKIANLRIISHLEQLEKWSSATPKQNSREREKKNDGNKKTRNLVNEWNFQPSSISELNNQNKTH